MKNNAYLKLKTLTVFAAAVGTAFAAARPVPRPALAARLLDESMEVYGIVHWGPNTFTDREWGYGDEDPKIVAPSDFNAGQIASACAAGGLGGLVVVAKHHDGFCLWPTKTTAHNISKSPFRGGKGDYVREMADACRAAGMKFGVYISPWDRNSAFYSAPAYVTMYHNQVRELIGGDYGEVFEMWFDGANGGDGYYGGTRGRRKISGDYYRFDLLFPELRRLQPKICLFNESDGADFRWPGNEMGILHPDSRATVRSYDKANYMSYCNVGDVDGTTFHPCEADFPLRRGWFYHAREDGRTKGPAYLMKNYLRSVGNGGTMNIGIAPNKKGVLSGEDVASLAGFGRLRKRFFANRVAKGPCNVVVMREDVSKGEHVAGWSLAAKDGVLLKGRSIGVKRIRTLAKAVPAEDLKLATDCAAKVELRYYLVDPELIRAIESAETDGGETDTAKWMTGAQK
ncbi:MAG: alpha-L-fucosidase [Kiritimatiellae bacterium]|nr:alpha-L-fucosidase [Kiritimatiellia bacterium]